MSDKIPHRGDFRCRICGGADNDPRGQGRRCHGFTMSDGWTHCARVPSNWADPNGSTWAHPPSSCFDAPNSVTVEARDERKERWLRRLLERTLGETLPATDPAAEPLRLYLASRGLAGEMSPALRFHPALECRSNGAVIGHFPAMVAVLRAPNGEMVTLHRTYLAPDGRKADVPTPRMLMPPAVKGSTRGAAIRLDAEPGARLAVGEGIETMLAFRRLTGWPAWSCYSAGCLETVVLPASVSEVAIALDNDPRGRRAANILAARLIREGRVVKLAAPDEGTDWNDYLIGGAA